MSKKRKISRYKMETVKLFVRKIGHLQIEGGKNNKLLRKKGKIVVVRDHNFIPELVYVCWMNEQNNAQ